MNFFFTDSIKKPALFSKNLNQFEGEVVLHFFYILFLSSSLLIGASCFATESSEKKIVSIVHTENLITILGGQSKKEDNTFNSYKVYTIRKKPNTSVFSSYINLKINKESFKVNLDDLNLFLVEMNESLKVHSHFNEGEITRRFNLALHVFKRKLLENQNFQSELPERRNLLIYPQDVKITDPENNNTPISYQEFKALLGLTRANSLREEKLEEKINKLENTLKEVQRNLKELVTESKNKPKSKRIQIEIRPRSQAEKSSLETKEKDDITSPRVTSDQELLAKHKKKK